MRTRELQGAGKNPKWEQVFELNVLDVDVEVLQVTVYDEDVVSRD